VGVERVETQKAVPPAQRAEQLFGIVMWLQIKQVPERAIANLPNPSISKPVH
jgi:hypothetical protein